LAAANIDLPHLLSLWPVSADSLFVHREDAKKGRCSQSPLFCIQYSTCTHTVLSRLTGAPGLRKPSRGFYYSRVRCGACTKNAHESTSTKKRCSKKDFFLVHDYSVK